MEAAHAVWGLGFGACGLGFGAFTVLEATRTVGLVLSVWGFALESRV